MHARSRRIQKSLLILIALTAAIMLLGGIPVVAADPAPAFAAKQLGSDQTLDLAQLHGSAVLLNIWATWCHPCRAEMPFLEKLNQTYGGQGLRVIGVNIDQGNADDRVRDFADK